MPHLWAVLSTTCCQARSVESKPFVNDVTLPIREHHVLLSGFEESYCSNPTSVQELFRIPLSFSLSTIHVSVTVEDSRATQFRSAFCPPPDNRLGYELAKNTV